MRDLGPCAGFADTPPGSVRMLSTSVQEVLQDCDERMEAHRYTHTWLIYDMYNMKINMNMIMNMVTLVLVLILNMWLYSNICKLVYN